MNSGVEGQKLLNFKGMGQGPAGQTKVLQTTDIGKRGNNTTEHLNF